MFSMPKYETQKFCPKMLFCGEKNPSCFVIFPNQLAAISGLLKQMRSRLCFSLEIRKDGKGVIFGRHIFYWDWIGFNHKSCARPISGMPNFSSRK